MNVYYVTVNFILEATDPDTAETQVHQMLKTVKAVTGLIHSIEDVQEAPPTDSGS